MYAHTHTHTHTHTQHTHTHFTEQGRALLFPDFSGQSSSCTPDDVSYFISEQNFDAVSGNILVGAA